MSFKEQCRNVVHRAIKAKRGLVESVLFVTESLTHYHINEIEEVSIRDAHKVFEFLIETLPWETLQKTSKLLYDYHRAHGIDLAKK